jgi:hypothetical protein
MINQHFHDNIFLVSSRGTLSIVQRFDDRNQLWQMLTDISLETWQEELPEELYCRVHHAHFLCLPLVERFEADFDGHGGDAVFANGLRFRVSRTYLQQFHRATQFRFASAVQKRNYRRKQRKKTGGAEKSQGIKTLSSL